MTQKGGGRGGRSRTTTREPSQNESASCPERTKSDEGSKQVNESSISVTSPRDYH